MIQAQLVAELDPFPEPEAPQRQSYQARFLGGLSPRENRTFSFKFGPIIIITKTSTAAITDDSYDGDGDGYLDVLEARDDFADSYNGNYQGSYGRFVDAIRNRATVNGGSIALSSLVLTSVNLYFDAKRLQISPCFPIIFEENFNIEMYIGDYGINATYAPGGAAVLVLRNPECEYPEGHSKAGQRIPDSVCLPSIPGSYFWTVLPDNSVVFKSPTRTFTLERLQVDPNFCPKPAPETCTPGEEENYNQEADATVFFEVCTQFSYFA